MIVAADKTLCSALRQVILTIQMRECKCGVQQNDSTVLLDTVPYAASGRWAINLWMKPGPLYGDNFQYLFSHAQQKFFTTGWESNQASSRLKSRSQCMSAIQYNGL